MAVAAVPRPWTPVAEKGGTVSVWGREYAFASNSLPVQVSSLRQELLAGPIRVVCADRNGHPVEWTKHGSWTHEANAESVTVCGFDEAQEVTADAVTHIEYDGMMEVSLALVPGPKGSHASIGRAWLEIPLKPELVKYYQYYPFPWGKCENAGGVKGPKSWPFLASVWLGDEEKGFCWFCESERGFVEGGREPDCRSRAGRRRDPSADTPGRRRGRAPAHLGVRAGGDAGQAVRPEVERQPRAARAADGGRHHDQASGDVVDGPAGVSERGRRGIDCAGVSRSASWA